ncbi:uncharacterized protein LOC110231590 [Exaiptasia diaphana]|uniref:Uncharacterized protein n=1 Tax=Exaiptasia diaphana TaxID=2652724 RepID=A0A913WPV2_EXADI|nr:uncharacterized protein LOC110231590 [Exaiptasia diaphana]
MKIEQDHSTYARRKHKEHGSGVYFTQLDHYTDSRTLIKNNFMKSGRSPDRIYVFLKRLAYVVKIAFPRSKVDKIRDGDRDIWIHRGDIHLKKYKNKHWIYSTQNPSDTL